MKTIILGNGFDLNLNFPTSYKDFIASTDFASNLWSGMPLAYGVGSHPSNLFRYIQSKAAEEFAPVLRYLQHTPSRKRLRYAEVFVDL